MKYQDKTKNKTSSSIYTPKEAEGEIEIGPSELENKTVFRKIKAYNWLENNKTNKNWFSLHRLLCQSQDIPSHPLCDKEDKTQQEKWVSLTPHADREER